MAVCLMRLCSVLMIADQYSLTSFDLVDTDDWAFTCCWLLLAAWPSLCRILADDAPPTPDWCGCCWWWLLLLLLIRFDELLVVLLLVRSSCTNRLTDDCCCDDNAVDEVWSWCWVGCCCDGCWWAWDVLFSELAASAPVLCVRYYFGCGAACKMTNAF